LGTDLREAAYLVLGEIEPLEIGRAGYAQALETFGLAVGFTAADGRPVRRLTGSARRATCLAMRDRPDAEEIARRVAGALDIPVATGTRYTVNVTPRRPDGEIATFDTLQKVSQGINRLGVLRMDVDDLGDLFRWGLQEATVSRVAGLSFALSLFFEGWVGELCRRTNASGADRVYAIYSGGDDLFLVGAWDALPELADEIRRDLARFAAYNPQVHISGGLTLHAGKYPLYQAAADAERALEAAKDLQRPGGHAKDAFNFLGLTIPWEEFETWKEEKGRLVNLVRSRDEGGQGASRSLLRVLLRLYARFTDAVHRRGKPYWGPWMWRGAYYLRRMEQQAKEEEVKTALRDIREALRENQFRYIEILGPAARWAELLTRKEQKDE
jgi:CRISPR-associated protein Csm1